MRIDHNVPLSKDDGVTITDNTRLRAIVPTTKFLLNKGANVILCSHFGRPKGKIVEMGKNGRLDPVRGCHQGGRLRRAGGGGGGISLGGGGGQRVLLLENTRFHVGETKNDMDLAARLRRLADYFVMDAFGTALCAHSSMAGVALYVKLSIAGFLLNKELKYLKGAVDNPVRPLCAIIGGAKV